MVFVERLNEAAHLCAQHPLHGDVFRGDDVDLDVTVAKRRSYLEPDEARSDDHGRVGRLGDSDDLPAVGKGAEQEDMRAVGSRHGELDRCGAGSQQQGAVRHGRAVVERDGPLCGIYPGHRRRQP